ncbi:methyl-accepting chemotaxis protein [Fontibacillus solani]|uniref:Methyl-accepting chemotaxis protein n=1 Tax=Fontibacillus solani TaxID=1572857 RepID=A0A7W3SP61_9BACL|nr:methyl-accepting chemotaxis protein [Fontibacillus solani]MBA9083637.1 methyl-accepting chemotaxis protein [Fontibacillus solani]
MKWGRIQFKSVGMKIFIILFATVVLVSTVLGVSSYLMSKEIIRGQVGLASSQAIEQAADKLDFLFTEYESISRQLAVDQTLKADLELVTNSSVDIVKKTEAETRIKSKLDAMKGSDSRLFGIRLTKKDLSKAYSSGGSSGTQNTEYAQAAFDKIQAAGGKPLWLPAMKKGFFDATNEPTLTMGRLLQNLKNPNGEFYLLIEVKDRAITDILSNLKIGKAGEVRVITNDNTIVHATDSSLIESQSFIGLDAAQLEGDDVSFLTTDDAGITQLVVYRQLKTVDWRVIGYAPESDFVSAADKLLYVTAGVLLFAVIVALLIGIYLVRVIGKPLEKLCNLMEEGEKGNLNVRTRFKGHDEIGRLGHSFNRMMEQISALVERTNLSAEELLNTAENLSMASKDTSRNAGEIAAATSEIAMGATSLAEEADKGVDIADQIGHQMENVMNLNSAMDKSVEKVIGVSQQGKEYMASLVEKTEAVSRMTGLIEENSGKLSRSTFSIRNILAPMVEMTKQTNILSLNASIEASRAGAAGKGFVVIAEEIRNLAVQSNNSIQTVSTITEEIQEAIENTVNVLTTITPMFDEQLVSVKQALQIFQNVMSEMESFVGDIQSSSASVHELNNSQSVLRDFFANVSAVVEETNASTQEVASMSSEQYKVSEELVQLSNRLEVLSETLRESLSVFIVDKE